MAQPMIRTRVDQAVYDALATEAVLSEVSLAELVRTLLAAHVAEPEVQRVEPAVLTRREPSETEWEAMKAWAKDNGRLLRTYSGPRDRATLFLRMQEWGWRP